MKKNYINPRTDVIGITVETLLAASEKIQRAMGGGGSNNAEVKREKTSTEFSNPVNWDE